MFSVAELVPTTRYPWLHLIAMTVTWIPECKVLGNSCWVALHSLAIQSPQVAMFQSVEGIWLLPEFSCWTGPFRERSTQPALLSSPERLTVEK